MFSKLVGNNVLSSGSKKNTGIYFSFTRFFFLITISLANPSLGLADFVNGEQPVLHLTYADNNKILIEDVDLLGINDEIKGLLDREIRPLKSKKKKVIALHSLFFTREHENIQYSFESTKTAQETYDSKSGNCLSHAALFVASARYLGLDAVFQTVYVPRTWEKKDNFLVVPGHLNVLVDLTLRSKATVEFVGTMLSMDALKSEVAKDNAVLGEYYNNKGAEALANNEHDLAVAYFKKSISTWDKSKDAWSNLGVTYRIIEDYKNAEKAYLSALKIDSKNITVINNLYGLYRLTNQEKKADKYFQRAERYGKKNPYTLFRLATIDYANGNLQLAYKSLQRAIKLKDDDSQFHHLLARIFYQQNKEEEAIAAIEKARDVAKGINEQLGFQNKINKLREMYES